MINKNKKGIATLALIIGVIFVIIIVYMMLLLPIPKFKAIRTIINYTLIIIFWVALQAGIIYGYFVLSKLGIKALNIYKYKIAIWTLKVKSFLRTKK